MCLRALPLSALWLALPLPAQQGAWAVIPGDPGPTPGASAPRVAFDRTRGRCVLVNGPETWEGAGSTWRLVATNASTQSGGAIAYDQARNVTLWFGGGLLFWIDDRTFAWDGTSWQQLAPLQSPSARYESFMSYDVARGRTVLFGGMDAAGALADTWEFDGTTWMRRITTTTPPARSRHRMAYDLVRAETVMYGGLNVAGDTWLYDGIDWRQGGGGPGPMTQHSLICDEVADRTVLTRGNAQVGVRLSTWEWDGASWTQVLAAGPDVRHFDNGAFDSVRGHPVLSSFDLAGTETLRWDGAQWAPSTGFDSLPQLPGLAAAHHAASRTTVAFGGELTPGLSSDATFGFAGDHWRRLRPPSAPGPRAFAAMAQEPAGHVLLLGGRDLTTLGDTWRWDGSNWLPLSPATSPPPRSEHVMALDRARARVVMFGGRSASGALLADTWEWDGNDWQMRTPAVAPPARANAAMTHDPIRGRTLLFGGGSGVGPYHDDLWQWDGTSWAVRATAVRPPARGHGQLTFDPAAGVAVLTGGYTQSFLGGLVPVADSWLWDGTSWTPVAGPLPAFAVHGVAVYHEALRSTVWSTGGIDHEFAFGSLADARPFGAGCAGSSGPPQIDALGVPRTGNAQFALWLSAARAGTLVFVGLDTTTVSLPVGNGCAALLPAPALLAAVTDLVGNARLPLPVPGTPVLHGLTVFGQALALDPNGGLPGVASLSAGLQITLD